LGVHAAASAAAGNIEQLANELFAFQQAIESNSELQFALAAKGATAEQRSALVSTLLAGKASAQGVQLIQQAVVHAGKRRASLVLAAFGKLVAEVANNLVATVTVAQELTAEQQTRLQAALAKQYGANIKLNIEHNETIIGGVRVQIADQIIDGSLASRLNQARLSLA
jgi:F-type H+-transporting ATPase subunit delta